MCSDIWISAPYEQDGQGAVYLYHGGVSGVSTHFSQRISATHLGLGGCSAFGYSIDSSFDVDANGYNGR